MDKEQIYDTQISPLMRQILAIAKEHDINFLASFFIPTASAPMMRSSSSLLSDDAPPEFEQAFSLVRDGFTASSVTTH